MLAGPFDLTAPLARPTARLYSPRQNLSAMSAAMKSCTSGFLRPGGRIRSIVAPKGSARTMSTALPQKRPQTQREVALEERAARALARSEELVEHFERAAGGASTLDQLEAQVSEALAATATLIRIAAAQLERPPILEVCEVALELAALHDEVRRLSTDRRLQALSRVQEALSHLRGLNDIGQMINRSTEELCRTVGFDRAVLF